MSWFVIKDNQKTGPFSDEELSFLIETHEVGPDDLVWKEGVINWTKASKVSGLFAPPKIPDEVYKSSDSQLPEDTEDENILVSEGLSGNEGVNKRSYLVRHWRGELNLPVSYWINGLIITASITLLTLFLESSSLLDTSPKLYLAYAVALVVFTIPATAWYLVGTWRSADNYIEAGRPKQWGNLAKIIIFFGAIRLFVDIGTTYIPQVEEYLKIITENDSFSEYRIKVLNDATELEVSGYIPFGLTDDVETYLESHPAIHTIHLNNSGGRVAEGLKLRDLIASRGLNTYTATDCVSACTIAYMAGAKRTISAYATLGFHQFSFPGIEQIEFQSTYSAIKQDWISKGVDADFATKAFSYKSDDMWRPSHDELKSAGIITESLHPLDVGMSGWAGADDQFIKDLFKENPLILALETHHRALYKIVMEEFITGVRQGKSKGDIRAKINPLIMSVFEKKLPYVKDSSLIIRFVNLLLEQLMVLYEYDQDQDLELCSEYLSGNSSNAISIFSSELIDKEIQLIADVLNSPRLNNNQIISEDEFSILWEPIYEGLYEIHGESLNLLSEESIQASDKQKFCEMTYHLYRGVLDKGGDRVVDLLRYFFSP